MRDALPETAPRRSIRPPDNTAVERTQPGAGLSPVQLRRDHVDAAEDGHDVADGVTLDELREGLVVDEARRAGAGPPGDVGAVGDDVEPELADGGLDPAVGLPLWRLIPAVGHDQLEVMNQRLDAAENLTLGRERLLPFRRDVDRPAGWVS